MRRLVLALCLLFVSAPAGAQDVDGAGEPAADRTDEGDAPAPEGATAADDAAEPLEVDDVEGLDDPGEVDAAEPDSGEPVEADAPGPDAREPEWEPVEPERAPLAAPVPSAPVEPLPELDALDEPDEPMPREFVGSSPRHLHGQLLGAWLELGFSGAGRGDERADFVFSPQMGARLRPDRGLVIDARWGFVVAATSIDSSIEISGDTVEYRGTPTRLDPGNPRFSFGYSGAVAPDVYLEAGIGVAVPTAGRAQIGTDADSLLDRSASERSHRAAMSMRGYWSPWSWAPERFSLFAPVRLAVRADRLLFDADLGLGVMVPVLGDRGVDPDVILQLGAGVGGEVAEALHLGIRLRGVGAPLGVMVPGFDPATGEAQTEAVVFSVEPWVRLRFDPIQIGLRGVISLNGADGVAGDRAPPFGLFVSVGGEAS